MNRAAQYTRDAMECERKSLTALMLMRDSYASWHAYDALDRGYTSRLHWLSAICELLRETKE